MQVQRTRLEDVDRRGCQHRADTPEARSGPAAAAAALERGAPLPDGPGRRSTGYAVLGVAFRAGDILALRRYTVTSDGPGYTCVWHRSPDGSWTFYADVAAGRCCTRYFGPAVRETVTAPIRLEWTGPHSLEVAIDGGRRLAWSLALSATTSTELINRVAGRVPASCWSSGRGLAALGMLLRVVLRDGRLSLQGRTPSGDGFRAIPRLLWVVAASRATLGGRDLGAPLRDPPRVALGDFKIPRRGLFVVGSTRIVAP